VTQLAATLKQEKQQTQTARDKADARHDEANDDAASAHRRKSSMLKGCGWGTAILLCLCWPAIPFWCCYTGGGAFIADRQEKGNYHQTKFNYRSNTTFWFAGHNKTAEEMELELKSLTKEIKLLGESEEKTSVIRGALPNLIKGFEGMYDFYVDIDTKLKGLRGDPKAQGRLRNQANVSRWRALHRELEEHHAQVSNCLLHFLRVVVNNGLSKLEALQDEDDIGSRNRVRYV
jgi:hypothetical protein